MSRGGPFRVLKKHCRKWNYQDISVHIAAVRHELDSLSLTSLDENGIWGHVSVKMGLENTRCNHKRLKTFWKDQSKRIQVIIVIS